VEGLVQGKTLRTYRMVRSDPTGLVATLTIVGVLLSPVGCTWRPRVHVGGLQDGEPLGVPTSRRATIESLSLALLENSSAENDEAVANPHTWKEYEQQAHVAITFEPPRVVRVMEGPFAISELLIPISRERTPDHILVRSNGHIRAFCKYDWPTSMALQAELRRLTFRPHQPQPPG